MTPRAHSDRAQDIRKGQEPQRSLEQEVLRSHEMFRAQSPNLTPFQEVISLTGRMGEEHGIVTGTSRQHTAVPAVSAPG